MYAPTTALRKLLALKKKIKGVQGGTSASKTISILMIEIDVAQSRNTRGLTSVVSESMPHLKRGALRDFKNIMLDHKYWDDNRWNATDYIYTFETGWQMEFFSADQADKLRGGRRDRLFGNEVNTWANGLEAFNQLEVRTKESVFLDWNPSNEFWFYTDVLGERDDVDHIILTYKDNEALSEEIIKSIEARRRNESWWRVYGLGQLGEVEGIIYKDWKIIDELPHEARLERYGLDFGWFPDMSALVAVYYCNGGYILDELNCQLEWANREIADYIKNLPHKVMTVADSAEPKSIAEISSFGIPIIGAQKGPDSLRHGIKAVQDLRISVTKRSTNIIKGYRNWMWDTDKDGKIIPGKPLHEPDALAAARYALETLMPIHRKREAVSQWSQRRGRVKGNVGV